ncbi:cyclin-dependent kinase inhibitor 4-like protein [Carex littledalei]|uniref:Cyclin-dependent kinase inhibitor n=1 Tax=Carex littledalei TaxID=544730 RepID=A0A833V810_9POAL|nr:cyclin-dependent kinase inhibitor 4-like protein [Carex littledalei]
MGKCTRKGKVSGEVVAVMDPPLGVRTRARTRTLALQKPSSDYLELRNRRLEKPAPPSPKPASVTPGFKKPEFEKRDKWGEEEEEEELEVSFIGENALEADAIDRSTRESTPCHLIMDPDAKCCTPGSTTRPVTNTYPTNRNCVRDSFQQIMPTPVEIEEFFSVAEQLQQRKFMEKYNFDPVNECPVPLPGGRYEWEKLDC